MGATGDILEILNQIKHETSARELLDKVIENDKFESMRRINPKTLRSLIDRHNEKYK